MLWRALRGMAKIEWNQRVSVKRLPVNPFKNGSILFRLSAHQLKRLLVKLSLFKANGAALQPTAQEGSGKASRLLVKLEFVKFS